MKEFIEFIAKHLVDKPESVVVEEVNEDDRIRFRLRVDEGETGKIIGKAGKNVKAMRTLLTALASKQKLRASLEIPDTREGEDSGDNEQGGY